MRAVLLAAGSQERWKARGCKQTVAIGGESLIKRTIRQLEAIRRIGTIEVVTHKAEIAIAASGMGCALVCNGNYPDADEGICRTALDRLPYRRSTVFVCADVVFTDKAITAVCAETKNGEIKVFADGFEIFAFSMHRGAYHKTKDALTRAHAWAQERQKRGRLWHFYRTLCGFPLSQHRLENRIRHAIDDATTDIDTLGDYERFLERHAWAR